MFIIGCGILVLGKIFLGSNMELYFVIERIGEYIIYFLE